MVGVNFMKKNFIFVSVGLIVIVLLGIGVSYSLWNISVSQDTVNTATTKCFNVEITSQKNSISLENVYPITNEKGKKLTPFSFTITNTCDIFASYTVSLESLKDSTLSSKFLNAMINNEEIKKLSDYEITDTVNTGSIESHILAKGSLGSGDSEDYTLRVWIDYDTTMEDLNNETKTFKSKIVVKAQPSNWSPVDEGYTTLHDAILANEYQTSPEIAIKKIEAKGTPDLSKTAPIITWKEKEDGIETVEIMRFSKSVINSDENTSKLNTNHTLLNIATSYSFNDENGIFKRLDLQYLDPTKLDFSKDYFFIKDIPTWTVSNGTKYYTVSNYGDSDYIYKILSATSTKVENGIYGKYDAIKYSLKVKKIISQESENDKSSKGLYYNEDDFGQTFYFRGNVKNNYALFGNYYWRIIRINGDNSIRLLYSHSANDNNNHIGISKYNYTAESPAYAGYMYGNNIDTRENSIKNEVNSSVKEFIDNWYINNLIKFQDYISDSGFCNNRTVYEGDGYSINKGSMFGISNSKNANFKCSNENDLFTLNASFFGNKALKYPIGLITIDELIYSGNSFGYANKLAWSFSSNDYLTMSPSIFDSSYTVVDIWQYNAKGTLGRNNMVTNSSTIRPVINLRSDVKISGGIGTINDPYVVE